MSPQGLGLAGGPPLWASNGRDPAPAPSRGREVGSGRPIGRSDAASGPQPNCVLPTVNGILGSLAMGTPPTVTIYLPGPLRTYSGGASQLQVAAPTDRAALDHLERDQAPLYHNLCDETGTVRRHLNVFVNADNIRDLDGVDTVLTPGDVVTFLPAVSGG